MEENDSELKNDKKLFKESIDGLMKSEYCLSEEEARKMVVELSDKISSILKEKSVVFYELVYAKEEEQIEKWLDNGFRMAVDDFDEVLAGNILKHYDPKQELTDENGYLIELETSVNNIDRKKTFLKNVYEPFQFQLFVKSVAKCKILNIKKYKNQTIY